MTRSDAADDGDVTKLLECDVMVEKVDVEAGEDVEEDDVDELVELVLFHV